MDSSPVNDNRSAHWEATWAPFSEQHLLNTPWTLPRLLADWNIPQPKVNLTIDGHSWGQYCLDTSLLTLTSGESLLFDDAIADVSADGFAERWNGSTAVVQVRKPLAQQLGAWRGRQFSLRISETVNWNVNSGGISNNEQNTWMTFDHELPSVVMAWVAYRLTVANHSEQ